MSRCCCALRTIRGSAMIDSSGDIIFKNIKKSINDRADAAAAGDGFFFDDADVTDFAGAFDMRTTAKFATKLAYRIDFDPIGIFELEECRGAGIKRGLQVHLFHDYW